MKVSRLLVLSSLGLVSLSASAADLIERTAPEAPASGVVDLEAIDKTPVDFVIGDAYVMYNPGSSTYYYRGNAWTTQASGNAENALLVRFVQSNTDGSLWLRDFDDRANQMKWRTAFITTSDSKACTDLGLKAALFVDNNDGDAALMKVTDMGDKVYRISVSDKNSATTAAGISTEGTYFAVTNLSHDADGMGGNAIDPVATEGNIDWQFYAVPDWTEYYHALDLFNKAGELKTLIEKAEALSIDVSAAVAVYNDDTATLAQIEAAYNALKKSVTDATAAGTVDNPTDATTLLQNPNFDNASSAGWSGTGPNMSGDGNHAAANVAEHYNKGFDTYQNLTGLPAGVYALGVKNFFRGSWDDHVNKTNQVAFVYATAGDNTQQVAFNNPWDAMNTNSFVEAIGETTEFGTPNVEGSETHDGVTYYIPNNPSTARLYFEAGMYDSSVFFATDGTARVGVKKEGTVTSSDWCVFDSFTLKYYGNSADSYKKMVQENAPDYTDVLVSKALKDDYNSTMASLLAGVSDKASADAAMEQIYAKVEAINTNIALWAQYQAKVAEATAFGQQSEFADYAGDLLDYLEMDAADYIKDASLDDAGLEAEIAKINQMMDEVRAAAAQGVKPGDEITNSWFKNCDFTNGNAGWEIPVGSCNFRVGIAEAYGVNFDIHQDYTGAKRGIYRLDLQGFFRTGRNNESLGTFLEGTQTCDAGVYLGTSETTYKTKLMCVFNEQITDEQRGTAAGFLPDNGDWSDGNYYANTMEAANVAFQAGMYVNSAYGIVRNNGETLRIGVGGQLGSSDWICWDNFRLFFVGDNDAEANAYLINDALDKLDLTQPMGKSVYAKAAKVKADAEAALASKDAAKMFDALGDIFDLNAEVEASVANFAKLLTALEGLMEYVGQNDGAAAATTAAAFYEETLNRASDHQFEDSEVPALLEEIQKYYSLIRFEKAGIDYAEASQLNPIDFTGVIFTPGFENEDGTNSVYGWNADGYNFGNDDTQKGALLLEFYNKAFDLNQTIYGLPEGVYEVKVNAFARLDEAKTNPVYLYANDEQVEVADLNEDIASMVAAGTAFGEGKFENTIQVYVSDGKLRIGIKKETNEVSTSDWVIMDNWQLWYYGKGVKGDVNGDKTVDVADISAIISQMAGTATYAAADVNGDGTVDVADISNVITIMANNARLAGIALDEE